MWRHVKKKLQAHITGFDHACVDSEGIARKIASVGC